MRVTTTSRDKPYRAAAFGGSYNQLSGTFGRHIQPSKDYAREKAVANVTTTTTDKRRKMTLRLPTDLYATTQEAVRLGLAPTENAFIQDAIRRRARDLRHAQMRRLAEEAMDNPGFVAHMPGTMEAFAAVDAEHGPGDINE